MLHDRHRHLLPAFKPEYLGETLLGLRRQTFRVIFSYDSPGAALTDIIRDRRLGAITDGMDLPVVRGPGDARMNHQQLWSGATPFVHLPIIGPVLESVGRQALPRAVRRD